MQTSGIGAKDPNGCNTSLLLTIYMLPIGMQVKCVSTVCIVIVPNSLLCKYWNSEASLFGEDDTMNLAFMSILNRQMQSWKLHKSLALSGVLPSLSMDDILKQSKSKASIYVLIFCLTVVVIVRTEKLLWGSRRERRGKLGTFLVFFTQNNVLFLSKRVYGHKI